MMQRILSLIEGSCVSAAECLMLGVPLAMLANAHVGSKAFITRETGRLLRPRSADAADDLVRFVDDAEHFRPRAWMMENGNEFAGSTRKLDQAIRREAHAAGEPWKTGIVEHRHVRLRPRYKSAADRERLAALYGSFREDYGVALQCEAG